MESNSPIPVYNSLSSINSPQAYSPSNRSNHYISRNATDGTSIDLKVTRSINNVNNSMTSMNSTMGLFVKKVDKLASLVDHAIKRMARLEKRFDRLEGRFLKQVSEEGPTGIFEGIRLQNNYLRKEKSTTKFKMDEIVTLCEYVAEKKELDMTEFDGDIVIDYVTLRAKMIISNIIKSKAANLLHDSWSDIPTVVNQCCVKLEQQCARFVPMGACKGHWMANRILQLHWDRKKQYFRKKEKRRLQQEEQHRLQQEQLQYEEEDKEDDVQEEDGEGMWVDDPEDQIITEPRPSGLPPV